jgi:hypothetical protein
VIKVKLPHCLIKHHSMKAWEWGYNSSTILIRNTRRVHAPTALPMKEEPRVECPVHSLVTVLTELTRLNSAVSGSSPLAGIVPQRMKTCLDQ